MRQLFSDFLRDRRGNVALWCGLAILPLLVATGAAIDYTRAATLRTKLQQATDATILAIAAQVNTTTDAGLRTLGNTFLQSAMKPALVTLDGKNVQITSLTVDRTNASVTLTTSAEYRPLIVNLGLAGKDSLLLRASSQTVASDLTYEIALVLDNSGSMASSAGGASKMDATKTAAKNLIDAMFSTTQAAQRTKISVVPFTLSVKVGAHYRSASWMDTTGLSSIHWENIDRSNSSWQPPSRFDIFAELAKGRSSYDWDGCVESRPGTWGVTDAAAVTNPVTQNDKDSLFVPQFAPDEPGAKDKSRFYINTGNDKGNGASYSFDNSYMDDTGGVCSPATSIDWAYLEKRVCKYKVNGNATKLSTSRPGPNWGCDALPLTRMTSQPQVAKAAVEAMTASGNTNLFEGFTWGWRTISPNIPFGDGRPYNTENNRKIIILMTDGENNWSADSGTPNKSIFSPFGYYINNRIATSLSTTSQARAALDAKTLQACTNAKASSVTVYTVGFSVATDPIDSQGQKLLQQCASVDPVTGETLAYIANNASDIVAVFNNIAKQLGSLRIAQ